MTQATFGSRLLRALGNLVLAMLNATLVLVLACLVFGYMIAVRIDGLTETFARSLVTVQPLTDEVAATRAEIAGLRGDLAEALEAGGDLTGAAAQRLQARAEGLGNRLDRMQTTMTELSQSPERIVQTAVAAAADEVAMGVGRFTGCMPGPRPVTAETAPADG